MQPSLDDIQQALNKATAFVLEVSRNIAQWGQQRFKIPTNEVQVHVKKTTHTDHQETQRA